MPTPVFRIQVHRNTNAPTEVASAGLLDLERWGCWSFLPTSAVTGRERTEAGGAKVHLDGRVWLLSVRGHLEVRPKDERNDLCLELILKGWGLLLLIGILRWRCEALWPRFVEALGPSSHPNSR